MTETNALSNNPRLTLLGEVILGFGIWVLVAVVFEPAARLLVFLGSWGNMDPTLTPAGRFALALCGGALVGWGVTLLGMARSWVAPERRKLGGALVAASIAWFVADSGGSVAAGAWQNTILNLAFLGLALWAANKD